MMRFLVDECCPQATVDRLRADGHDVRYVAETDQRASDVEVLALAQSEGRILVTEDFDFGELLIRDRRPIVGAVIVFMPKASPMERAPRLAKLLAKADFDTIGALTVVENRRVRQRRLTST